MLKYIILAASLFLSATQAHAMRWYSPNTGRWFSRDPINENGFNLINNFETAHDFDLQLLAQQGAQATMNNDTQKLKSWLLELETRHKAKLTPYSNMESLRADLENASFDELYVFNQNDPIDKVDKLGLISWPPIPVFHTCVSCKLGLYICVGVFHPPSRFPKQPFALWACLDTAKTRMNIACLVADHKKFDANCKYMLSCFQQYW